MSFEAKSREYKVARSQVHETHWTYRERAFEGNLVLPNVLNCRVRNGGLSVFDDGCDVDGFPRNGGLGGKSTRGLAGWIQSRCGGKSNLCSSEDVLDRFRDLGANAITLDQADNAVSL